MVFNIARPNHGPATQRISTKMPFRWNTKTFYMTFSQNDTTKEAALAALKEIKEIEWAVVGHELHEDGGHHLHLCGKFTSTLRSRDCNVFDIVGGGKHGKYEPLRDMQKCIAYCTKDKDYIAEGIDVDEILSKKEKIGEAVMKLLVQGETLKTITEAHPGYMLQHIKKAEEMQLRLLQWNAAPVEGAFEPPTVSVSHAGWEEVVEWLTLNLLQERPFKQKQLWLYGPPNVGKTTMIMKLETILRVYMLPLGEAWCDDYCDGMWDLVVLDDYKGERSVTWMNRFCDGSTVPLSRRGRHPVTKKENVPVVVLSNFSICDCYCKCSMEQLSGLRARFLECRVTEFGLQWAEQEDRDELAELLAPVGE